MNVWLAAFSLAPRWPRFVLFAALIAIAVGRGIQKSDATAEIYNLVGFVPPYLDIDNPLFRLAFAFVALWIVLEILLTIMTRVRIRRDNEIRKKR